MKTILVLDLETSGTDPTTDHVVEIGAVLFSVEHCTSVASFSTLLRVATNGAAAVNHIPETALVDGTEPKLAWQRLAGWVDRADAIIGHNCEEFDRLFVPSGWDKGKPWIDTMTDVEWPRANGARKLIEIALAHGIGVASAHRALTDCNLIASLLERVHDMGFGIEHILTRALRPKAKVIAQVSYDNREQAKALGFQWDGSRKIWWRRMFEDEISRLPFPTIPIQQELTGT